jgi:hypothetical protein
MTDEATTSGDGAIDGTSAQDPEMISREDFRRFQAKMDQQLAQEKQRAAVLAARIRELDLGSIEDESERARRAAELEAQDTKRDLEMLKAQAEKANTLNAISNQYGVPVDALEAATSEAEAYRLAIDYLSNKPAGNPGKPVTGKPATKKEPDIRDAIAKAKADGNVDEYVRLINLLD